MVKFIFHNKSAALALCLFLIAGLLAREAIGRLYGATEAIILIEALSRAGLYLGSAIATASTTTMALMLTLIGVLRNVDEQFGDEAYEGIRHIASLSTASLLTSLVLLLAFTFPSEVFENLSETWLSRLYDVLFATSVVMVALSAATAVTIYGTIRRVISKIIQDDNG